jgi:hypothetical protein
MSTAKPIHPEALAPVGDDVASARARCDVGLWLVTERVDGTTERWETNADVAWAFTYCPYEHLSSGFESPTDGDFVYYAVRR